MKSPFAVEKIKAWQIFDSRGIPTIEVEAYSGVMVGKAIAPAGVSRGRFEAHDKRDGEKAFRGMGVQKVVSSVNTSISRELKGKNACALDEIDQALIDLDGTNQKTKLGSNAMIATSMAVARLGSQLQNKPLYEYLSEFYPNKKKTFQIPMPLVNLINGGKHAGNKLPFQEVLLEPVKARSLNHALQMSSELYQALKEMIAKKYGSQATSVGDTGGFAVPTDEMDEVLEIVLEAAKETGYEKQIRLALSMAASHFRKKGSYVIGEKKLTHRQLVNLYANLVDTYPISLLEDPFAEDDLQGFQGIMSRIGNAHSVVGDDLLVSNPTRMKRVMDLKACNGLNLKINQVGTLKESVEAYSLAREAKWKVVLSDRAGDSEDSFISDLAVGLGVDYLKAGGMSRSERMVKYNRLIRIEDELGKKAVFKK
jgi:enolase